MKLLAILAANAALLGAALTASADDFEIPVDESPAESLPPTQVMGENFHVQDPVHSDGLMHHYVVDSRFGVFHAYGHDALTVRLREVAALTTIARTSDANVVLQSVSRGIQDDARAALQVAKNPIGTDVYKRQLHWLCTGLRRASRTNVARRHSSQGSVPHSASPAQ